MGFTPYKYFNGTRFINKMLTLFRLDRNKVNTKDSQQEALVNSPQAETFEQGTKSRHKIKAQNQDTKSRHKHNTEPGNIQWTKGRARVRVKDRGRYTHSTRWDEWGWLQVITQVRVMSLINPGDTDSHFWQTNGLHFVPIIVVRKDETQELLKIYEQFYEI